MDSSYLSSQVATIISQLHGLFDEIGFPNHERESRESELFAALSETLHNQVRLVAAEKNEMSDEAHRIITTIKQMEISLDDTKARHEYEAEDENLKISYPLIRCLQVLKEKHLQISKIHRERFEQVKKLVQALESYSSHLEKSFIKIALPPTAPNSSIPPTFDLSPSYVTTLDNEFTRVYEEYTRRVATVKALSEHVIQLWAELGTPQAQTDAMIVKYYRDSPEQLGLHEDDIARLRSKRDKLGEEKKARERRLKELRNTVEGLWDRLGVDESDRKKFLNSNRGCGVRQINEFEDELSRLNELKRQNLHLFVEDARFKLQELWDGLYFSEEEMLEFTPAFSDVYSDALLSAHEQEIARLEALTEQRAPTLALIEKHRSLVKDRDELAASSQDASRLMMRGQKGEKRDPTRLLREEKMRKRITKDLPKIAVELRRVLEKWEDEYGRPFLVHGERYTDELDAAEAKPPPGPRSKTPAGPPPAAAKNQKVAPTNRSNSSIRPPPPPRTGAKTPVAADTLRRNPLVTATINAGGRTPSRIPARPPLSNLKNGNNSPERRGVNAEPRQIDTGTMAKMAPPPRAPPPRMKDLFEPPPAPTAIHHFRSGSVESNTSVRQVSLEDVYDDSNHARPYSNHRSHSPQSSMRLDERRPQSYLSTSAYPLAPPSRQTSNTSAATTTVSGSENWETFDDVSEPDHDAAERYRSSVRSAGGKRPNGEHAHAAYIKKQRGYPTGAPGSHILVDQEGNRIVSGETNWTDEDVF